MTDQSIAVTTAHHAATDMAVSPDRLWRALREGFVEARKFRDFGFAIEPLDDPSAPFGGYRMRLEQGGEIVDDRICRLTEVDDKARRISIFADYISMPLGLHVYVTYQAHERDAGSRYTLDCHARMGMALPSDGTDIATMVANHQKQQDDSLDRGLAKLKAELEGAARALR